MDPDDYNKKLSSGHEALKVNSIDDTIDGLAFTTTQCFTLETPSAMLEIYRKIGRTKYSKLIIPREKKRKGKNLGL